MYIRVAGQACVSQHLTGSGVQEGLRCAQGPATGQVGRHHIRPLHPCGAISSAGHALQTNFQEHRGFAARAGGDRARVSSKVTVQGGTVAGRVQGAAVQAGGHLCPLA